MGGFEKRTLDINGVRTVVLEAGAGDPLVFFHGAGTLAGFDFALPWAERFRVIAPHHPGFGESADDPSIDEMHDYVLHYLDLFEALGLDRFHLVGHSMGGWMAARFACEHGHRVRRLALASPAGLRVAKHPTIDIMRIPPDALFPMLVEDMDVLQKHLPDGPDIEFVVARYREAASVARIAWERPYDRKLARWLHRISMPTLLVWGEKDRLVPVQQAKVWAKDMRVAKIATVKGVGHLVFDEAPESVALVGDFLAGAKVKAKAA
jgi:pimeloyl-ACP methyl ester carboxylesterase